jgi:hypothetical protein
VLLVYKSTKNNVPQKKEQPALPYPQKTNVQKNSVTDSSQLKQEQGKKLFIPQKYIMQKNDTANTINKNNRMVDSLIKSDITINRPDSEVDRKNIFITPLVNPHPDSLSAGGKNIIKKSKGVKGINDKDYKIVSQKKDSLKNKN